jgi:hypothetical protein
MVDWESLMQILPIQAVANQKFSALLSGQQTDISIYLLADGNLYIDIYLNNAPVVVGVLLLNKNKIIRNTYFGYLGDFFITDTQGSSDPAYTGLGVRYQLVYMTELEAQNV